MIHYSVLDHLPIVEGSSARDAIHAAVMRRLGCSRILTFDQAFDAVPGVQRVR